MHFENEWCTTATLLASKLFVSNDDRTKLVDRFNVVNNE